MTGLAGASAGPVSFPGPGIAVTEALPHPRVAIFLVAGGARARSAGPARMCGKGSGEGSEWAGPPEVRGGSAIRYPREPIIVQPPGLCPQGELASL